MPRKTTKNQLTNKQAIEAGIGLGAMSQLSRNTKIRSGGEVLLIFALIAYVGELIKLLLKWLIWKPFVLVCKGVYYFYLWGIKLTWYFLKYSYKFLKFVSMKLYTLIKQKYELSKAEGRTE